MNHVVSDIYFMLYTNAVLKIFETGLQSLRSVHSILQLKAIAFNVY